MLTTDLLVYTRRGERIVPRLLDPARAPLAQAAADLLALAKAHRGQRRGDLEQALKGVAVPGLAPRVAAGLGRLVLQRCTFDVTAPAEPVVLRTALFDAAAAAWRAEGRAGLPRWRPRVVARVAAEHGLTSDAAEAALFADLPENQRLTDLRPLTPAGLVYRYNVAQVQGLLLRAGEVAVQAPWPRPQRLRQLFHYLKFYGLLYAADAGPEGELALRVDGPLSVLQGATRYGLNLAQFFPALLLWDQPWTLTARLEGLRGRKGGLLELAPHPLLRSHLPDQGQWVPEDARRFVAAFNDGGPWRAEPAEELLALPGNRFLIPDFRLTHGPSGRRVYLEHLLYPSAERVAARAALIAQRPGADYLVACRGVPSLPAAPWLVTYRRTLLPSGVRRALDGGARSRPAGR